MELDLSRKHLVSGEAMSQDVANTNKSRDEAAAKYAEYEFNYWKTQSVKTNNPTLHPASKTDYFKAGWDAAMRHMDPRVVAEQDKP